ncbi:hypothetical protein M3699_23135 [Peribacillus simplex]|uniref:hypothetical protein n=1 Tax=Peribacillus simplex TaxID=1478 RepID=UPI00203B2538|nr:hypothetical protein [Peribacillus simplex]MCM3676659.1 hypothetical protein [Peribacillus simplex]
MDKKAILTRVLKKVPLDNAMDLIQEKFNGWVPEKKPRKKEDIREKFLSLSEVIRDEEIEDFVQMAVMKKSVGLPAYTYRLSNINFIDEVNEHEFKEKYNQTYSPYKEIYSISTEVIDFNHGKIELNCRLKEYEASWKTGTMNIDSLSAVYTAKITINNTQRVMTIFCGNHSVQEILMAYLQQIFGWPLNLYRINEVSNQLVKIGSASYKTSVLLDLVYNRLKEKGIESTFKELKFYTGGRSRKDGIKDVAIGGRALLSSQLACEYVTLGSHIIYFKLGMTYEEMIEFTTKVYLKGNDLDILKIVILDTENENIRLKAMDVIQQEYIDMCTNGIKDIPKTVQLLTTIRDRFINKDQLILGTIKENALNSIASIAMLVEKFDDQDIYTIEVLKEFSRYNRTLLDSVGFDGEDENLNSINNFVRTDEVQIIDEDDYEDFDDEAS